MTDEEEADAGGERIADLVAAGRWDDAIKILEELIAEIKRRKNAKKHAERNGGE
jgi:hypothetical protein